MGVMGYGCDDGGVGCQRLIFDFDVFFSLTWCCPLRHSAFQGR
jgi:hypothetical protein